MRDPETIDRIVREVVRRLSTRVVQTGQDDHGGNQTLGAPPATENIRTLRVTDNVVTARTLENRLFDVKQVVVNPRAVVTPLVKDILRAQAIAFRRASEDDGPPTPINAHGSANQPRLGLVVDGSDSEAALRHQLNCGDAWRTLASLADGFQQLETSLDRIALVTSDWALRTYEIHRRTAVRAASIDSSDGVLQALQDFDAQVLVINAKHRSSQQQAAMLNSISDWSSRFGR